MSLLLEDRVILEGHKVTASLTQSGVLRWEGWGKERDATLDILNDVIGVSRGAASLTFHSFLRGSIKCCGGRPTRVRKDYLMDFGTAGDAYDNWSRAIQRVLDNSGRPKRLLVLVNPFGGKCRGGKVYQEEVEPMFRMAGIQIMMRETQFQSHAKDLAKSFDLSQYDGIVCVSGDGVLAEVLNGLLERADWDRAIKMPIGVIPAGTGNGMAKSILESGDEEYNAANATFAIIRGRKQALDIATCIQGQVKYHSLLMLSWGFVSDVDFESEKYRYLGGLRIDLQAYIRLFWLRHYNGSLAYVPAPGSEHIGDPLTGLEETKLLEKPPDSDTERPWRKNGHSAPLGSPLNNDWRSMEGSFIYIWAQNVPYAGTDILPAPKAKFSDGYYDLIVIRDCPRWKLIGILLSMKNGTHVKSKYVHYLKVKAFRLAPGGIVGGSIQGGFVDLDGEILARGQGAYGDGSNDPMLYGPTIDVTVEKGLATIFVPPFV
ncbi:unnamed protein product [Calypogeia fissa]